MRKKKSLTPYILGALMLLILTLPFAISSGLRSLTSSILKPFWEFVHPPNISEVARLESRVMELEAERALWLSDKMSLPQENRVVTGRVIFRSHQAWQSFLWLDKGDLETPFQLMKAPVLMGDVLIGVVDEVKPHAARVRLLTDSVLVPSVRVFRDGKYLAKGELNGLTKPTFRQSGTILKGSGFNYDFPDAEGPAKSLREDILKPGDLLVTTGFDGVFPKGLKVAKVLKVLPLKEGDTYYNLEAESLAGTLNDLEYLQVIPPMPAF
ncbi:MAG: hypothetical protein KDK62_04080 [Chlamydiia bacterium]|nr:hypothetical protein [Chlamydiia bacterium]